MNFQSSSIFYIKLIITFCELVTESYHFQSLLPSCIKRFTTKGEQTLSHFLFIYVGGGGRAKKEGEVKAISDWLEGGLNFFVKMFRGVSSLIARYILRGVHWPRWIKQLNSRA